jgi:DNA-binding XRE family transcriptional regulator
MQSAKIKEMRKVLGMNQVKFADTLGISQGFLSDLEKGSKTPSKSLSLLLKKLYQDQDVKFEKNVLLINKTASQSNSQNDLKVKYITLMEEHVKCLSEIINLKEEIYNLKQRHSKVV